MSEERDALKRLREAIQRVRKSQLASSKAGAESGRQEQGSESEVRG